MDSKLILYTGARIAEAYERGTDPFETRVLPDSHPAYRGANTLRRWHEELLRQAKSSRPAEKAELPEKLVEELRALGYLD